MAELQSVRKVTLPGSTSMHRVLLIRDILLDIFKHCSPVAPLDPSCHKADLAALARTCQTFKDPALDVLWETLFDLSPLARCLPEACRFDGRCYSFSRSLSDAEWNILRGYTRRVRFIEESTDIFSRRIVVLPRVPFTEPLFPNLRSLFWEDFESLPVEHTAVSSLTSLALGSGRPSDPLTTEILDSIGECCPNIRILSASFSSSGPLDAAISRHLCQWTSLQRVDCREVTLSMDFILHLPSLFALKQLSFTLSANLGNHTTHLGPAFVLSNLANLGIESTSLKSITTLFSRIQLPKIKDLDITVSEYTPRRHFREYWTTVQRMCPSNTLSRLVFISIVDDGIETLHSLNEQSPCLALVDLLPYKDFGNLRQIDVNVPWSVNLTDADLLDLVSTSPHLEELDINSLSGWNMHGEGGITLRGLVQLLRRRPSLGSASLAIDTRTFTQIPHGLDVSFLPRESLCLDCLDSHFPPEFYLRSHSYFPSSIYLDFKSVFAALRLNIWSSLHPDLSFSSSEDSEDSDTGDESDDADDA